MPLQKYDWIRPIAGLFHLRMAVTRMILSAHEDKEDGRDILSMKRFSRMLGRTKIWGKAASTNFHQCDELIRQVTEALVLSLVMTELNVYTLGDMREKLKSTDWVALIENMVEKYTQVVKIENIWNGPVEGRDVLLENASLMLQHGLMYLDLSTAIRKGDTGRVAREMEILTVLFHGGTQYKYAAELLDWSAGMCHSWSDSMKLFWYTHCVVNLGGRKNKFLATDEFNEYLVSKECLSGSVLMVPLMI